MNCYKTVPFKFTDLSWLWLTDFFKPIVDNYQQHAPAVSALVKFNDQDYQQFVKSSAWTELVKFLQPYGITDPYPQLFIYKQLSRPRDTVLGNPHIDTAGGDGTAHDISVRFNVLITGNEETEMVWWIRDRNDSVVLNQKFTNPAGQQLGRLQVAGSTLAERWQQLGEPDVRCSSLGKKQQYASFVRTDVLHALNWSGAEPRLVLSIRSMDTKWNQIELPNAL